MESMRMIGMGNRTRIGMRIWMGMALERRMRMIGMGNRMTMGMRTRMGL